MTGERRPEIGSDDVMELPTSSRFFRLDGFLYAGLSADLLSKRSADGRYHE